MLFGAADSASREQWLSFLLVFQRWAATTRDDRDTVIPPTFAADLQKFLFAPNLNLDLVDASFNFRVMGRPESSRFKHIYEFSLRNQDDKEDVGGSCVRIKCVRGYDSDRHILNLQSNEVKSETGHYMCGKNDETTHSWEHSTEMMPPPQTARELVFDHWINPKKWVEDRNYVVVRPKDAAGPISEILCKTAKDALKKGYSMLLFVGGGFATVNLVQWEKLSIAGILWRESDDSSADAGKTKSCGVPDGLALILAEGAPDHRSANRFNEHRMFEWGFHQVYEYRSGEWGRG